MRMGNMSEARGRIIDALIAEPYNRMPWTSLTRWMNINKLKIDIPDIKKPQNHDSCGKTNDDAHAANMEISANGTGAWCYCLATADEWRSGRFKETFPEEKEYRHTLMEDKEALTRTSEKVNEALKDGRFKFEELDPGIKTLLKLYTSELLEPYILFHLADKGIVQDYPAYRKSHRDKLRRYLERFVVPKSADQKLI